MASRKPSRPTTLSSCICAHNRDSRSLSAAGERNDRVSGKLGEPRSAPRSPSGCAASAVKLTTQPSVMSGSETKAVRGCRREQDGGRRNERQHRRLERHLAAAAFDQKDLKEVAVSVCPDASIDGSPRASAIVSIWMKSNVCSAGVIGIEMKERQAVRHAQA